MLVVSIGVTIACSGGTDSGSPTSSNFDVYTQETINDPIYGSFTSVISVSVTGNVWAAEPNTIGSRGNLASWLQHGILCWPASSEP